MDSHDIVIVGAGLYGLIPAKTCLEISPTARVTIFDNEKSIGGMWCKDRLYPGLKTQNLWAAFEFSDFPMTSYGLKDDDFVPGEVVHDYLVSFAKHFDLIKLVKLQTKVIGADLQGAGGWKLHIRDLEGDKDVLARQLIVVTGLTSEPMKPQIAGIDLFGKPVLHTRDWGKQAASLADVRVVTVLGSSKAAMDVANHYASRGIKVDWIFRKSGHGPVWDIPPYLTPLKIRAHRLVPTRFIASFSPCIWADNGWWRRFLQRTRIGRKLVVKFFADSQKGALLETGVDKSPATAKLKPWTDMMWCGCHIATLNYDNDFMALIRDGTINVYISDVDKLKPGVVALSDGTRVETDALFCATGWKFVPPINFSGVHEQDLGLPRTSTVGSSLEAGADEKIFREFPILRTAPTANTQPSEGIPVAPGQPYRLFRFAAPPRLAPMRSLAFAGALASVTACLTSQTQALWIAAFLLGKMSVVQRPTEELESEAYLHTQFCKRRSPMGFAFRHADFSTDSLPFLDSMLRDLGLRTRRKSNFFWEFFEPYGKDDYVGLTAEWLDKQKAVSDTIA